MPLERMVEYVLNEFCSVSNTLLLVLVSCILWKLLQSWMSDSKKNRPPGPIGIPFFGYLPFLEKESYKTLRNLKYKYGDIIGLYLGRQYTVVLNEYKVAKEILNNPDAIDRGGIFNTPVNFGFNEADGDSWKEQRRFCFAVAKDLGLGRGYWEDMVIDEISNFVHKLKNLEGKPINIADLLSKSTSMTMLSLLFGRRFNDPEDLELVSKASHYSDIAFVFLGPSNPSSIIPGLRKICEMFKLAGHGTYLSLARTFQAFIRKEISKHKTSTTLKDYHDFINIYLEKMGELSEVKDAKHWFTEHMLEGNLNALFLGGSDTTSKSLEWIFRLLAKHKDVQNKVYQELMESVGKDGKARVEEKDKIPYTFATIMETERVASIVPLTTTRKVTADIHINGMTIPKGSDLFVNAWALHNDTDYWDKPEEFRPERFLTSDGLSLLKQPPSFGAFSMGKRNCPGEFIAYKQMLFFFSETVKNFEISTPDGKDPRFDVINGLVINLKPQLLCFKERVH